MALNKLSEFDSDYPPTRGHVPAQELADAVTNGLLTQEEARYVMWSQLPALTHRAQQEARKAAEQVYNAASLTPPSIEGTTNA